MPRMAAGDCLLYHNQRDYRNRREEREHRPRSVPVGSLALTMPAASTPIASSTARSGVNFSSASFITAQCGPSAPAVTTTAATLATTAAALTRRTTGRSTGSNK